MQHQPLGRAAVAALALAAAGPAALAQNLVVNGSFESPGNGQTQVSTVPDGWSLIDTANGVDIIGAGLGGSVAADGLQFLDLIGGGQGAFPSGVYQDLALTAGTTYRLQFAFNGAIYDDGSPTSGAVLKASVASLWQDAYPVDAFNAFPANGPATPWQTAAVTFTAQATGLHRLSFSTDSGAWGSPYVDAVSVTAVPEPGTWAMAAAGLLGLGAWRRRAAAAA
jgi:MYXO-CTERM domain-containing protein